MSGIGVIPGDFIREEEDPKGRIAYLINCYNSFEFKVADDRTIKELKLLELQIYDLMRSYNIDLGYPVNCYLKRYDFRLKIDINGTV